MSVIVGVCPWALACLVVVKGVGIFKRSKMLNEIGTKTFFTLSSFNKETNNTEALKNLLSLE